MRVGVLFSGGKDSCFSAYKARLKGDELACLITLVSENPDSYMFHTPNISMTKKQSEVMNIPILAHKTMGKKEQELKDLENAIKTAIKKYSIHGIVTGALHSDYQASRIKKICSKLDIKCINPLWHKDELKYLNELVENRFKVMITGVAAYPLDKSWLGKIIDGKFIEDAKILKKKYKIHPAGEGGEFETFVLDCPLFSKELKIVDKKISGEKNSWKLKIKVE